MIIMNKAKPGRRKLGLLSFNTFLRVWHLVFLAICTIVIFMLISGFIKWEVNTFPLEADLFWNSVLYDKEGISYYDDQLKRVYPSIIDYEKFTDRDNAQQKLIDAFDFGNAIDKKTGKPFNNYFAAKLTLEIGIEADELYYNELLFRKLEPVGKSTRLSFGDKGVASIIKHLPVIVLKGGREVAGVLTIDMLKPRSIEQYAIQFE